MPALSISMDDKSLKKIRPKFKGMIPHNLSKMTLGGGRLFGQLEEQ